MQVLIKGTNIFQICGIMGSQEILNKYGYIGYAEIGVTQNCDASVDGNLTNNRDSAAIFSKVLGRELSDSLSTDIYFLCRVCFTSNSVGTKAPDFVHLGLPAVNISD